MSLRASMIVLVAALMSAGSTAPAVPDAVAEDAPEAPAIEIHLVNGRTMKAISAVRDGADWPIVLPTGTVRMPASRVQSVGAPADARSRSLRGYNVVGAQPATTNEPSSEKGSTPAAASSGATASGDRVSEERRLRSALIAKPGDGPTLLALGRHLALSGRFSEAIEPLRSASGLSPQLESVRVLTLAETLSRLDRTDEALAVLAGAPAGDEQVAALRKALETDAAVREQRVLHETTHYTIQAPFDVHVVPMERLGKEIEEVHEQVAEALGGAPREKVIVILYPGGEFWESTGMGTTVGGLYDGKVRVPAARIDPPTDTLRAVLRHEVAHAFVDALSAGNCDRTWHEGIAEHFEGDDIRAKNTALGSVYRRDPTAWPPVFDHPTSHSLVEYFLATHGMGALRELLVELSRGKSIDAALVASTGAGEADLHAAWGRKLAGVEKR